MEDDFFEKHWKKIEGIFWCSALYDGGYEAKIMYANTLGERKEKIKQILEEIHKSGFFEGIEYAKIKFQEADEINKEGDRLLKEAKP